MSREGKIQSMFDFLKQAADFQQLSNVRQADRKLPSTKMPGAVCLMQSCMDI